jgi:hypothetical protein
MDDGRRPPGCGTLLFVLVLCVVALAMVTVPPRKDSGTYKAKVASENKVNIASDNEVLSRNQLNILSTVKNFFYECGEGGCTEVRTTTNTTENTTRVDGRQNTVVTSDGQQACQDPKNPNVYSPYFCPGQPGGPKQ